MPQFVGKPMPTTIHVWPTLRPRFPMLCASPVYHPAGNEGHQEGSGWQGTPYPMSNRGAMRCGTLLPALHSALSRVRRFGRGQLASAALWDW